MMIEIIVYVFLFFAVVVATLAAIGLLGMLVFWLSTIFDIDGTEFY